MNPNRLRTIGSLAITLALAQFVSAAVVDYPHWPGVAVVKIAATHIPDYSELTPRSGIPSIDAFMDEIGATGIELKFVGALPPTTGGADITRYYNLYFPKELAAGDVCYDLLKVAGVETAEPWQIDYLFLDHNDPQRGNQYGMTLCESNAAHDISTGNRSAPVAIVDTGTQLNHPDLAANIWINPGEDLNGDGVIQQNERNNADDDRNGQVDDFNGWDFVERDNLPNDQDGHGTHTAGIASAVTNNRVGVASVGYSCAIMVVRSGVGGQIQYGYEGINYAVRSGAKVISCSWGGDGHNDWTAQVIRAALQNDVLVLAAAGNDNRSQLSYPAAYNELVAVAATDRNDRRAGFSNYGDWVDVSAPGVDILSTVPGGYAYYNGTSMACPFAASVAVLIRATYPEISALETRRMLLEGADPIEDSNPNYRGELGSGRINALHSLELGNRPMLTIDTLQVISDGNQNGLFDPGEEVEVAIVITNGANGQPAEDVTMTISTADPSIEFANRVLNLPDLNPGETTVNSDTPFDVTISDTTTPRTTWLTVTIFAEPGAIEISREFEIVLGHPSILLVDDDEGMDLEDYYLSSIEATGRGWVRWDVFNKFSPDAATLIDYDMVIWETGDAQPPLDDLDRYQIETALADGANILLIGNRIGDDEANRDLLRNSFGARHEQDSVGAYTVVGAGGGSPLTTDLQMLLTGDGAANPLRLTPSSMSPAFGGDTLSIYMVGQRYTGISGIYRHNQISGSRTAYLGFAFECVSNVRTPRSIVIDKVYDYFMGIENDVEFDSPELPTQISLSEPFPNPFNGQVSLKYALPLGVSYTLAIYDSYGREAAQLSSGIATANERIVTWNADNFPSGRYFARLHVTGKAPIERSLVLIK